MGTMSKTETLKAAKVHECCWCGQKIEPGETYRRYRWWNTGDAGTAKLHPECYEAMLEAADEEGGWFEWMPGDGERPLVPNDQVQAAPRSGVAPGTTS